MIDTEKIGLGGGCHWCTEAVFQSLTGVISVEQGYISSTGDDFSFSEGVIVNYNPKTVNLKLLIKVHLLTHKSTVNHSMRDKYRSAIYVFSKEQKIKAATILSNLSQNSHNELVTRILDFNEFKASRDEITNYYFKNPEKPFCETFINPKLKLVLEHYSDNVDLQKLKHLTI